VREPLFWKVSSGYGFPDTGKGKKRHKKLKKRKKAEGEEGFSTSTGDRIRNLGRLNDQLM